MDTRVSLVTLGVADGGLEGPGLDGFGGVALAQNVGSHGNHATSYPLLRLSRSLDTPARPLPIPLRPT